MGTDAILTSKKKKLYLYIDRKYNVDPTGDCDYDEWEEGVSPKRAKELVAQAWGRGFDEWPKEGNYMHLPCRYWLKEIRIFIDTLDEDDIVELVDDSGMYKGEWDDVYWYIKNEQWKIDHPEQYKEEVKEDGKKGVFYHPDYTGWREWKPETNKTK